MEVINLDAGLYLEDRSLRLAWQSPPEELRRLTRPDYCVDIERFPKPPTLAWNDRVFGLRCQVTATFPPGGENLCGVRLCFVSPKTIRSMPQAFAWLGRQLPERFGPPLSIHEDGERGEARWVVGGVALRHEYFVGMGGGHYLFIYPEQTASGGWGRDP